MKYYKLVDAITQPINVSFEQAGKNGGRVYAHERLEPGMAYEMPDDPIFESTIRMATTKTEMSNKDLLDSLGITYEVIKPHCHCRKPYLKMRSVEVFESESD